MKPSALPRAQAEKAVRWALTRVEALNSSASRRFQNRQAWGNAQDLKKRKGPISAESAIQLPVGRLMHDSAVMPQSPSSSAFTSFSKKIVNPSSMQTCGRACMLSRTLAPPSAPIFVQVAGVSDHVHRFLPACHELFRRLTLEQIKKTSSKMDQELLLRVSRLFSQRG